MATFEETSTGFKAVFQKTYNDTGAEASLLATRIESSDLSEKYTWLGNFPQMKEWIGERDIKALTDFGYQIHNKLFEASISVPNTHIEYDKVGLYKPAVEQMAQNAKLFGAILVADVLISGNTNLCYDGKPFFATDHEVGADTYSNSGSGVLNPTNLLATRSFMMSIKSPTGKSLRVNPNMLVCGPKSLSKVVDAIDKERLANGESNPTYKMFDKLILPEISGDEWYLLDTSKPLKPFILQVAKDGIFESNDGKKFELDSALFGVKSFMNAGYGLWQFAYRSTGVA